MRAIRVLFKRRLSEEQIAIRQHGNTIQGAAFANEIVWRTKECHRCILPYEFLCLRIGDTTLCRIGRCQPGGNGFVYIRIAEIGDIVGGGYPGFGGKQRTQRPVGIGCVDVDQPP